MNPNGGGDPEGGSCAPGDVRIVAVGGVTPGRFSALQAAGADAFGIGSDLYRPGRAAVDVHARARELVRAWQRSAAARPRLLCNPLAAIGEAPVLGGESEIVWVDPIAPRLLRYDLHGQTWREWRLPAPVWSLAALADGAFAGTGDSAFCRITAATQTVAFGPAVNVGAGCRLNDMTIDRRGGLWAGSMHRGLLGGRGALFHAATPEAPARQVAGGLGVANGMAFSDDQRTLYVVDTLARTLLAYPADVEAGTLGEPTIVTDFLGVPGKPDGMAIAPDGSLWVAMWGSGAIVRVAADGCSARVDRAARAAREQPLLRPARTRVRHNVAGMRLESARTRECTRIGWSYSRSRPLYLMALGVPFLLGADTGAASCSEFSTRRAGLVGDLAANRWCRACHGPATASSVLSRRIPQSHSSRNHALIVSPGATTAPVRD